MLTQWHSAFTLFISLLVEAFPFLLLGVVLSSLLLVVVDEQWLTDRLPRHPLLGALMGSCLGFLFPVCECGNVPVARRFLLQGISPAVAVSFLLAAPTINPVVIWATWTAFRDQPSLVLWRIAGSLVIATVVGWIFSQGENLEDLLSPNLLQRYGKQLPRGDRPALLQGGNFWLQGGDKEPLPLIPEAIPRRRSLRWGLFLENVVQELRELGGMLVLGSGIAAAIQVFVPRDWVLNLGQGVVTSLVAMMALAAIVSICSTVDAFFALSFAGTFTSSSLLAFLIFGPMIDIKALGLMLTIFRPRLILYFFGLAAQMTFLIALGYGYFV